MKEKMDADKELRRILQEEVNNEINNEILKALADPSYKHNLTPFIFESEEQKLKFKEMIKRNLEGK